MLTHPTGEGYIEFSI